ncbi:MAG: class I SAM-dependent methyltransferase [Elusimicrobiota bacterium]
MSIFDKYADRYDQWYDENKDIFLSELNALKKFIPETGKGLEVGVGTGRFASELGVSCGIDPSSNMLKKAKDRGIETTLGNGESMPYDSEFFDFTVNVVTICFVNNPEKVIEETYRVLKNGGIIIAGFIEKNSKWGKYYKSQKNSPFYNNATFYTFKDIKNYLKNAGFKNIKTNQVLFAGPGNFKEIEEPRPGHKEGSFITIKAGK